jgi:hypothetical protein
LRAASLPSMKSASSLSVQALNSEAVRTGIKDVLLNNADLYETLREQGSTT